MYVICFLNLDDLFPFVSNSSYRSSINLRILAFCGFTCHSYVADKHVDVTSCVVSGGEGKLSA